MIHTYMISKLCLCEAYLPSFHPSNNSIPHITLSCHILSNPHNIERFDTTRQVDGCLISRGTRVSLTFRQVPSCRFISSYHAHTSSFYHFAILFDPTVLARFFTATSTISFFPLSQALIPGEFPSSFLTSSELEKDHVFRVYDNIAVHWNHTRGKRKVS